MTRRPFAVLLAGLLAAACGRSEPPGRYNVILISLDSVRADRTGPYGHVPEFAPDVPVTPTLDRLAADGATFESAWSTTSWTLPSHMALMTGLDDRCHGVEHDDFALDPLRTPVAEVFQEAGYATGGCYSGPYLDPKYGFDRGFDEYRSAMLSPQEFAAMVQQKNQQLLAAGRPPMTERLIQQMRDRVSHWDVTSPRIEAFAADFLERHADDRFFLFLHFFDAHYDYHPDPELARLFDPDYDGPYDGTNWFFDEDVMTWATKPPFERRIPERDLRHVMAMYDAEIHWVDAHVGRILQRVADLGLEDDTLVVVTADHGDEFFDHGSIGHRSTVWPELCRVPLVIRVPGGAAGRRVPEMVSLVDVAPTLLELCGLPPLPEAEGRSLAPFLEPTMEAPPSDHVTRHRLYARFDRSHRRNFNVQEGWRNPEFTVIRHLQPLDRLATPEGLPFRAIVDPDHHLPFLVYDRREDPAERHPLPPDDPRYAQAVAAMCADWDAHEARAEALPRSPKELRYAPEKSAEELATLNALGYADQGGSGAPRTPPLEPFPAPCPEGDGGAAGSR